MASMFRFRMLTGCACGVLAASFSTLAAAQAVPDPTVEDPQKTIVVTGSRIPRPDLEASSPVAVVGRQELTLVGTTSADQILNTLPQFVANDNQYAGYGNGTATVDLRGLGAARTLVLVNGRRYIVFGSSQVVDLNTIPEPLIQRIEVVTGGRSAVYGSDALAGVVNFILKDDFKGLQVGAHAGISTYGDGAEYRANVVYGLQTPDGNGNLTFFADYFKRKAVFGDDRDYARIAQGDSGDGQLIEGGSSSIPGGRLLGLGPSLFFNKDGTLSPYSFDAFHFNFNPPLNLQVPADQKTAAALGHYTISPAAVAYVEAEFVDIKTTTQGPPTSDFGGDIRIQVNSPFLPESTRTYLRQFDPLNTGYVDAAWRRRFVEFGNIQNNYGRQAYRFVGGLRGDIGGGWQYDGYFNYSHNKGIKSQLNSVYRSRMQASLFTAYADPSTLGSANPILSPFPIAGLAGGGTLVCADAVARAQGCVPANLYGPNNVSEAAIAYLRASQFQQQSASTKVANLTISNADLFATPWGGNVGIAAGAEYRREKSRFDPDDVTKGGDVLNLDPQQPLRGGYDVKEVFGELNAVLIKDRPLIDSLEINTAARYSHYSTAGGVFSYAAGASYSPITDVTFRGQYQRATRSPNVGELYSPNFRDAVGGVDPCNNVTPGTTLAQRCLATGVPASLIGTLLDPNAQLAVLRGGSTLLDAERSTTWTGGVVLRPRFAPGLSVTADYYKITIDKYVGTVGGANIASLCYEQGLADYCALITRSPIGGNITLIRDTIANTGGFKTSGVDVDVEYRRPLGFGSGILAHGTLFGSLRFTYLKDRTLTPIVALPEIKISCAGRFGVSCGDPSPHIKGQFNLGWSNDRLGAFFRWVRIGEVDDDGGLGFPVAVPHIGAVNYFNASLQFHLPSDIVATVGVANLTNRLPPVLGDNSAANWANTWPATYDPIGRRFFIDLVKKF